MINKLILTSWLCIIAISVQAMEIEITDGVEDPIPVAIVPFAWTEAGNVAPVDVAKVVRNDLTRSGRFNTLTEDKLPETPSQQTAINFRNWRMADMDNLLIGDVKISEDGLYIVTFQLFNVHNKQPLAKGRIKSSAQSLRRVAHQISDIVYEKLLGVKGAFSTRIAYITVKKSGDGKTIHSLKIADSDGENVQTLIDSPEPLLSPNWAPDGRKLAYVSFEKKNSSIIVQDIFDGSRSVVQSGQGINSSPAWSPDGRRLAMTLSKDGNPEIYIKHLSSGLLQRVTNNPAIDTEASWSPDGQYLAFTSNRSGRPQIYRVNVEGGKPQRLSFEGKYNTRPIYSPTGDEIAIVTGGGGQFRIAVLEPDSGSIKALTDSQLDESPSFAPNGHMIIYTAAGFSGSRLAVVSNDGQVKGNVALQDGEVREPAWGPLLK